MFYYIAIGKRMQFNFPIELCYFRTTDFWSLWVFYSAGWHRVDDHCCRFLKLCECHTPGAVLLQEGVFAVECSAVELQRGEASVVQRH